MSRPVLLRDLVGGGPRAILVDGERIVALDHEALASEPDADVLRADGLRAVPGFVDWQINGVAGRDFTTDPAAMWEVGPALARHGVTAFLPTVVSSQPGVVERALRAFCDGAPQQGAIPLGVHAEGPYLAPERRGAHEASNLRHPDSAEVAGWLGTGALRVLTIAPELPGALDAIGQASAAGVMVSAGHTDADADTTARAIDAGIRAATHLFNAMAPFHHRSPGAAGALLADSRVTVGLIADGRHVDPVMLGLVARLAGERMSIVSDATAALDDDGTHAWLGEVRIGSESGVPRLPDGTLAGGAEGIDDGVGRLAGVASAELAIRAASEVPARLLGLDHRGRLEPGLRADIALLDRELHVRATIVGGAIAFDGDGRWR